MAIQAAPDYAPPNGATYPVYVINPSNAEVQSFNVVVWYDWEGGHIDSTGTRGDDGRSKSSGASLQHFGLNKEAYPVSGDPEVISAMQAAHYMAWEFAGALMQQVDSQDLPHVPGSAVGLIGPYESSAGYARLSLQGSLADHYENLWGSITFGAVDMAVRIGNRFLGSSSYVNPASRVTVQFPDGTTIEAEITVGTEPDGSLNVQMEVDEESARLPDGRPVPQAAGHMDGFNYSGDMSLADAIADLAFRFGVPVSGPGGSNGIGCVSIDDGPLTCLRFH